MTLDAGLQESRWSCGEGVRIDVRARSGRETGRAAAFEREECVASVCAELLSCTNHPPGRMTTSTSPTDASAIAKKKIGVYLYLEKNMVSLVTNNIAREPFCLYFGD
jgi:hypothetical protein